MRNYLTSGLLLLALLLGSTLSASVVQDNEVGIASYYSDAFQGRRTASGESYDMNKMTAAHKSLPFGTIIRVTRLDNKKSVKVRINDRGPYIKGRIVDLSKAAAIQLDLVNDGKAQVEVVVVGQSDTAPSTTVVSPPTPTARDLVVSKKPEVKVPEDRPSEYANKSVELPRKPKLVQDTPKTNVSPTTVAAPKKPNLKVEKKQPATKPVDAGKRVEKAKRVIAKDYQLYDLYKIQLLRPERTGFGVQVASLSQYEYVMKQVAELQEGWFNNILINVEKGKNNEPNYKIILGPFADRETAESYKKQLKKNKKINGFVVDLSK